MNAWVLAILPAAVGVDFGWERKPDGTIEYVIQIEPDAIESMKTGNELISDLPPALRNITTYKIKVGSGRLPNHNQLPPELQTATTATTAAPLGASQPFSTPYAAPSPSSPSYSSPSYGTSAPYATTPNTAGYAPAAAATPSAATGFVNSSGAAYGSTPTTSNAAVQYDQFGRPLYPQNTVATPQYDQYGRLITPMPAATATTTQYDQYGRPYVVAATSPTLPTGSATSVPTSTSGFPMTGAAGSTGYYQPPGYAAPTGTMINPATGLPVGAYQQPVGQFASNTTAAPTRYAEGPQLTDGRPYAAAPAVPAYNAKPAIDTPTGPGFVNTGTPSANGPTTQVREPQSPGDQRAASGTGGAPTTPAGATASTAEKPQSQWLSLTFTLVLLFLSIGGNLYFGWTTFNLRERYRMLLSDRPATY